MIGRAFIRLIAKRGIPLSCIASKLNCRLSTLKSLENKECVPRHYLQKFTKAFKSSLTEKDIDLLAA